jgi:hypothetical protein
LACHCHADGMPHAVVARHFSVTAAMDKLHAVAASALQNLSETFIKTAGQFTFGDRGFSGHIGAQPMPLGR